MVPPKRFAWLDASVHAIADAALRRDKNMTLATEELAGDVTKIILDGRMDIEGAAAIDLKMNVIAGSRRAVLVDLQKVSFLGSMGLRTLVTPARAMKVRGGKMVLFGPSESVEKVLKTSGIDALIPVHHELSSALAELQ
jgi:anti-anti-sigma factor